MLTALRYFIEIYDSQGFTPAAKKLNVAQPTLTRSLQNLEFQLDTKLIERGSRAFELTPAGALLLKRGRMLLAEHRSLLSDLSAIGHPGHEQVTVNGSLITSLHLLPQAMLQLAIENPDLRVSLVGANDANYTWKRDAVLSGELDVAISIYEPANAVSGLIQELLIEPVLTPMVRSKHPIFQSEFGFEDLLRYRWIMMPGEANRATIATEFRIRGLPSPSDIVEVSEWRFALDLLRVTDCVTIVPYHPALLATNTSGLAALPIEFHVRPLAIGLLMRPLATHRAATEAFVNAVKGVIRDAGGADVTKDSIENPDTHDADLESAGRQ
jgi:DNA-binding transcriptional LysR family regulator